MKKFITFAIIVALILLTLCFVSKANAQTNDSVVSTKGFKANFDVFISNEPVNGDVEYYVDDNNNRIYYGRFTHFTYIPSISYLFNERSSVGIMIGLGYSTNDEYKFTSNEIAMYYRYRVYMMVKNKLCIDIQPIIRYRTLYKQLKGNNYDYKYETFHAMVRLLLTYEIINGLEAGIFIAPNVTELDYSSAGLTLSCKL